MQNRRKRFRIRQGFAVVFTLLAYSICPPAFATAPFAIHVIDEQTGRGVPLVELRTVNDLQYVTDSAGWIAFNEPGLMDREVYFHVSSDGYEYPADGFGYRGIRLTTRPGNEATIRIKRLNIAERLYRVTGGGIYRDSVRLGKETPIRNPVLNGDVLGQDTVQNIVYRGKLFWFWGDTSRPNYPLGNFHMAGATSILPANDGLDPALGVDLTYFVNNDGFAKDMAPHPDPGPVWMDAFVSLTDESGRDRMYGTYARVAASMEAQERGFMRYDDDKQVLEKVGEFDVNAPVFPSGHPFTLEDHGIRYLWFPSPFPLVRVRADAKSYLDVSHCEAWTPLTEGCRLDAPTIDRDTSGRIRYAWKRNTPPLDQKRQNDLIKAGKMKPDEAWIQLQDSDSGGSVIAHSGSVYWNAYRQRWITVRCESGGTSFLGETWYAEADTPLGPWVYARKIVTHRQYSFYNPKQHPNFDQNGGRVIYFEGTYANTFSGNAEKTPRYDYNQIMYRLNLADERLVLPVPVYRAKLDEGAHPLATRTRLSAQSRRHTIAFFALDRPIENSIAMRWTSTRSHSPRLEQLASTEAKGNGQSIAFYALPADMKDPPATTTPLYEYVSKDETRRRYSTSANAAPEGWRPSAQPVCRVWKNPLMADWQWE